MPTPANDDIFSDTIDIGFNFNFYGNTYSQCVISPNNFISFNLALANLYSEWNYTTALASNQLDKAIMFPYQDLNATQGGAIKYKTIGAAPNRKFIVEFCDVPFFFCPNLKTTGELILFETSNNIEMHLTNKPNCNGWYGSSTAYSIQGIKSTNNQMFVAGRGPNDAGWSITNDAVRFTPIGNSYTLSTISYNPIELINPNTGSFAWYAQGSNTPFATTPCTSITTAPNIDYYVAKFTGPLGCINPIPMTITDTVFINHTTIYQPITLSYCTSNLPATWNGITIPSNAVSQNNYDTVLLSGGACDTNFVINLVIDTIINPSFSQVNPICANIGNFTLPAISQNGVTGSWTPNPNNTNTTTYTFSPNAGQCATGTSMTVTVNPTTTPVFSQVATICSGDPLAPLPTTSNNGITGTWSPAINNTASTTYTFTPNASANCYANANMTVTVNQKTTPNFNIPTSYCTGANIPALPSTSQNGISGTWTPTINNTSTTTYTFTPNSGQCAESATITISINQPTTVPLFDSVGPYCIGSNIPALPSTSNNGISGTWTPAINNLTTTNYTFTPNNNQCGAATNQTIVVTPLIEPMFNPIGAICQGSIVVTSIPTTSLNGISGTWSPAFNNNATTTYTFTPNPGQCADTTTMTVSVDPSFAPTFNIPDTLCAGAPNPLLNMSTNGISGTWSPAYNPNATGTYTFTPNSSGACYSINTKTINIKNQSQPNFNQIGPLCSGSSVNPLSNISTNGITGTWTPAFNNNSSGTYTFIPDSIFCAATVTMNVTVNNSGTTPTFTQVNPICQGASLAPLPLISNNGISGTWSPNLNNTSTTTYTFTPDNNLCGATSTMTIVVDSGIIPSFTQVPDVCFGVVMTPLPTTSNNGISGTWSPYINSINTTTYTFTPNSGQCASATTMTINVVYNIVPTFSLPDTLCVSELTSPFPNTSINGYTGTWSPPYNHLATTSYLFIPNAPGACVTAASHTIYIDTLKKPTFNNIPPICAGSVLNPLPTTSLNGISGNWTPALNNTTTTSYTFTPDPGQCGDTAMLTIIVNNNSTIPEFDSIPHMCYGTVIPPLPNISNNGISGTWFPSSINNTQTTTYTFTPSNCGQTTTKVIEIDTVVKPTFNGQGPICAGGALSPFPGVSLNGIKGTWSPALNNMTTTSYIFTPSAGSCADTASVTIIVNPIVTPTFTQINPICAGANLAPLPTISNNGVTGSWSPNINNQSSTTYSFTSDPATCGTNNTTMTIVVHPIDTPIFTQVAPICAGGNLSPLPSVSNNNITGTWSPNINNNQTTTYTFTPDSGQCAPSVSMTIVVHPIITPTFTQVAAICAGASLQALPTTSTNNITGTWSPALNNSATTTYTFIPTSGVCVDSPSMTITVNPIVHPTFTQVNPICAGASLIALPNMSNNGVSGTWSPAMNNNTTTTYTFSPSTSTCADTAMMTIIVNSIDTPNFIQVPPICAGGSLNVLPSSSINNVSGTWSPAPNNLATTTYTFTPLPGLCAVTKDMTIVVNPMVSPTFTQVAGICAGASLSPLPSTSNNNITGTWSPLLNNNATTTYTFTPSAGQCADTPTMTIVVNPIITPTFTQVPTICTGSPLNPLPTMSNNGVTGTWSPAMNNTTTTIYTFAPISGQCADTVTMTINVNPIITPVFTQVPAICAGASLPTLPTISNNGITGTWSPALNNMATTIYTFTPSSGICAAPVNMTITVNPIITPTFSQVGPICQGTAISPLPTTSSNGVVGSWSPAINNMTTTTYTFTPSSTANCQVGTNMQIVVNPYLYGTRNVNICANGSYIFNGITYTNSVSGVLDTLSNANACDSIISLNLTVHPLSQTIETATICQGSVYTFNGQNYTSNNTTASYTLPNQWGCDSTITLHLTVIPVNTTTNYTALDGCGTVNYNGFIYNTDTNFVDTTLSNFGCDSIYNQVSILVYPEYHEVKETKISGCFEVEYNGVKYTQTTYLEEPLLTVHGCDSFIHKIWISVDSFGLALRMEPEFPYKGETVTITSYSPDNIPYTVDSWTPSFMFPNQHAIQQRVVIDQPVTITVAAQSARCKDTAEIVIASFPELETDVQIPNAFSPNGDGRNDVFIPVIKSDHGYSILDFNIYNRYGGLVYAARNMNSGWDGYYKGVLQDSDVYFYAIKIQFVDGTIKEFKGDLTLIK